jgi:hypothetical protein
MFVDTPQVLSVRPSFLLLLFLVPFTLCAQTPLRGKVVDKNKEAVPFAQVVLYALPDSAVLVAELTDSAGGFIVNIPATEKTILLRVAAIGYEQYFSTEVKAQNNIDIVLKEDAFKLKGISVVAKKPLLERRADRTIFNVSSSIASIGADAYELLKRAPGVRVSENNGISLVGKSTVSVMIDNKLQQLGAAELAALLRSMSADNIDKIEVITTPPARYEAQGNSGIINIVTKRIRKDGLNGNLMMGFQQRTRHSKRFGENLNFRKGRVNIYSSGNTNAFDFQSTMRTTIPYATQVQTQVLEQRNRPLYNRYQLGMDVDINLNSVVGITYAFGSTDRKTLQNYNAPVTTAADGVVDSILRTKADEREKARRHVAGLSYEWRIDTAGKKLNIDADYFLRHEDDERDFETQTYLSEGATAARTTYNRTLGGQDLDIRSVKADLIWPVKFAELSFGGKLSAIKTRSDNRFEYLSGSAYVLDITRTNLFDYTENTQALYASASKKLDKIETQFGLRFENTQTRAVSHTTGQNVPMNYFQFFPTVYLQYALTENHVFNINYSRRVGRPSYEELNPFREYGTGNSYEAGNPFLQPSFYHTVELSYNLMSKYTFTAYTGIVDNIHARVSHIDSSTNSFYFTSNNAGTSVNAGANMVLVFSPLPWWECNVQADGFYDRVNSNYYNSQATVNGITAFRAQTNNAFTLNKQKTLLAEIEFEYNSRFQYDFEVRGSYYVLFAGAKALFFNQKLVLGLNCSDILRSEKYVFENIYNGVRQNNYFDARQLHATLTWRFGSNKIKAKRQREVSDELRRAE